MMKTKKIQEKISDDYIAWFYESRGEAVWELERGRQLIMMWTSGDNLQGTIQVQMNNEDLQKVQFIRTLHNE